MSSAPMDGVLVVDKPSGPTSHDVVVRVRAALKIRRIGHTGTLDPLATGVLPLVIGRATRLAQFLAASTKTYEATVRLGIATDTFDMQGRVTEQCPVTEAAIDPDRIERALASLRGSHLQIPPSFSAKKIGGVRSHALARQSAAVALEAVQVTVDTLELLGRTGDDLHLRVTASAGFYVRSLANTIGRTLGVCGCLAALRRIRSGDFDLTNAVALDDVERDPSRAAGRLVSVDDLLSSMSAVTLTPEGARRTRNGAAIRPEDRSSGDVPPAGALVRLIDEHGHLCAVGRQPEGTTTLHPLVVLG